MRTTTLMLRIAAPLVSALVALPQAVPFSERTPRYHLQPLDVIEIHYRFSPEFDQTLTIQPDGFAALQLVGDTSLQGLTLDEAKAVVLEKAGKRLRDPEVNIVLKEFEKPYFTVGGEVTSPGRFEMKGAVSPLQAIAMAGGFKTGVAKHSQVVLLRRVGPDLARTEVLDLRILASSRAKEGFPDLHSGDMLVVPQNKVSKIERYVKWINFGAFVPLR